MGLRTWLGLKKKPKYSGAIGMSSPEGWCSIPPATVLEEGLIEPDFPIDVVYTWVDGNDPEHRALRNYYSPKNQSEAVSGSSRFTDRGELRYSLRSIETYAPWVNHIFIVTNGQRPDWLSEHPRVSLVTHDQILEKEYLPTFNSHVIGSALHRIPGLSEHYIYFNDDVLLLRPTKATDAFTGNGLMIAYLSEWTIPASPRKRDTYTIWAAKNAHDLVLNKFGRSIRRRMAHIFHPQLRSVSEECEMIFADVYHEFRANKFRAKNDLLCNSFLHQAVAYLTGRSIFASVPCWYVKIGDPVAPAIYARILSEQGLPIARIAACFNDVGSRLADADAHLSAFFEQYFPYPSSFETHDKAKAPPSRVQVQDLQS